MKTVAIICEYNPFHRGHEIQIKEITQMLGQVRIIALMSGNIVQRGQLAIYSKYTRARAAIMCGVDLVLELPCVYSCGSAEYFAYGAVSLLNRLGSVDYLCFGSESGEITKLAEISKNMRNSEYISSLKSSNVKKSHQRNSEEVYRNMFSDEYPVYPNDILGVEYISALSKIESEIQPITYKRCKGYTASDTREAILSGGSIKEYIPDEVQEVLEGEKATEERIYSAIALYTVRNTEDKILSECYGMNGGVSGLLKNKAFGVKNLSELIESCTCSKYSSARLRRAVLSSVLGIKKSDVESKPFFTRLLASNECGREYLSSVRRKSEIAVITKKSDTQKIGIDGQRQLELCSRADALFAISREEAPKNIFFDAPYIV